MVLPIIFPSKQIIIRFMVGAGDKVSDFNKKTTHNMLSYPIQANSELEY